MITSGKEIRRGENNELVGVESHLDGIDIFEDRHYIRIGVPAIGPYNDLITITKKYSTPWDKDKVEINWGGTGTQCIESTQVFVRALNYAVELANLAKNEKIEEEEQ